MRNRLRQVFPIPPWDADQQGLVSFFAAHPRIKVEH